MPNHSGVSPVASFMSPSQAPAEPVRDQTPELHFTKADAAVRPRVLAGVSFSSTSGPRRPRKRFILWLLASIVMIGTCVHFLHTYQMRRNAVVLVKLADRAEEKGQGRKAASYLGQYLGFVPEDMRTQIRFATLVDNLANTPKARNKALQTIEQVLRREPHQQELRRRAVRDAMELQLFSDASKHIEVLLRDFPRDAELEQLAGQCYAANGELSKAVTSLERAVKYAPKRIEASLELTSLLRLRLNQPERADKVMDAMIAANPKSAPAHLARARYRLAQRAYAKAAEDFKQARQLAPESADVLLASAELAMPIGWRDGLQVQLSECLKKNPRDDRLYAALARLQLAAGERAAGIASLRQGLRVAPAQADLLAMLAETRIQDGELKEADQLIVRLQKSGGSAVISDYLKSRVFMQTRRFAEAAKLLESIRTGLGAWPDVKFQADLDLGHCYERLGDGQAQLGAYRRAVAGDPASATACYALAATFLAQGMVEDAVNELKHVVTLHKPPDGSWTALAQALTQRNLQLPPGKRNWLEVGKTLDRAEAASPDSVATTILRAEFLSAQSGLEQAQSLLQKACAAKPGAAALRIALADLLARNGQAAAAFKLLHEARQQFGDRVELRLACARYWSRQDHAQALKAFEELGKDSDKFPPEDQVRLLRGLAELAYQLGDPDATEGFCKRLIALQPLDKQSRLLLFDLALQSGRDSTIEQILADLRRIEGEDGALWKCGDAARLILRARRGQQKSRTEARIRLAEVALRWPGWSYVSLLEALLDELEGDQAGAVNHYLEAIEKGDQRPQVAYRAAQLLSSQRRHSEAQQVLRKLESRGPLQGDQARLAAEVALRVQDPQRALELAARALPANSRDYRDYLWLAGVQEEAGRQSEAKETLRKAVARGSNIPDTWAALIRFVARTESPAEAEVLIQEAKANLTADRAPLALARCYEAIGRFDQSEQLYQTHLQDAPDDLAAHQVLAQYYLRRNQALKAEPHLRLLIEATSIAPAEQVAWARRQLALILTSAESPNRFAEALALIEANLALGGGTIEDQRVRAFVQGSQAGKRREATRLIEETIKRLPLTPDEQCRLARLYEAAGDRGKAREQFVALLTMETPKPAYLASYTRFLARQGEPREAARWLTRLEKLDPDTPQTREVRAFVLESQKVRPGQKR